MPREVIHWSVVHTALAAPTLENSALAAAMRAELTLTELGAMGPDAPLHLARGQSLEGNIASNILHGSGGEDPFLMPAHLLREDAPSSSPELRQRRAFAGGFITHLAVDSVFHPMVNSLTGNFAATDPTEADTATRRHRLFETALDQWALRRLAISFPLSLAARLADAEQALNSIVNTLAGGSSLGPSSWHRAFHEQARLQGWFLSTPFGIAAHGLCRIAPRRFSAAEALFAARRRVALPFFDQRIKYCCPKSGEPREHTIAELHAAAAARCVEYLLLFDRFIESRGTFALPRGASLDTGTFGGTTTDLRHFCFESLPKELR